MQVSTQEDKHNQICIGRTSAEEILLGLRCVFFSMWLSTYTSAGLICEAVLNEGSDR